MENTKLRESKYDLNMKLRHSKIQKLIFISNKFVSIIADAKKRGGALIRGRALNWKNTVFGKARDGRANVQTD